MAAPPDQDSPSMASSPEPTRRQQQQQQQIQGLCLSHETDSERWDLDPAVAAQLIKQTTSLTLSNSRGVGKEPPVPKGDPGPSGFSYAFEASSPAPPLPTDAQQHSDTLTEEWRETAASTEPGPAPAELFAASYCSSTTGTPSEVRTAQAEEVEAPIASAIALRRNPPRQLSDLPNEVLLHILSYLEVCDLLATSRTSHHLRTLSLAPHLHRLRLRRTRAALPPLLASPSRPSLAELTRRCIVQTPTAAASRRLARSLASIRLARQLASRPTAEVLVARCVLPRECLPSRAPGAREGAMTVAPGLVARKRAVERERVKDGLRRWVGSVMTGEVRVRGEGVERAGVGRVSRLRRFWERVGQGEGDA